MIYYQIIQLSKLLEMATIAQQAGLFSNGSNYVISFDIGPYQLLIHEDWIDYGEPVFDPTKTIVQYDGTSFVSEARSDIRDDEVEAVRRLLKTALEEQRAFNTLALERLK